MNTKSILIKDLLEKGYKQKQIAQITGLQYKSIYYYIKKYNIKYIPQSNIIPCNDSYFNNIDTEAKAYLLGFILADGYLIQEKNIKSKRICLNNSIDDISIFELFQKEIAPKSKIIKSNKQTGVKFRKEQITIRITSFEMFNTLNNKFGIIQNKTNDNNYSFPFNQIPVDLYRHFIRGYFDGDGSVSFHENKYNTIFFNFSFVFNSENFCKQIANIFKELFKITPMIYYHKGKTANWYSLRFNYNRNRVEKIKLIYDYLYKDSLYFLNRKKVKFDKYLEYRANSLNKK